MQTGCERKIFRSSCVKPMVRSERDRPYNMNIPCDGEFSIGPKMTDEDIADEKARALVSSTSQNDKITGHVLNDRGPSIRDLAKSRSKEIQDFLQTGLLRR